MEEGVKKNNEEIELYRSPGRSTKEDGNNGIFYVP
jgi:hypothetical protein